MPMDHPRLRVACLNYTKTLGTTVQELRSQNGWNCVAINVYEEFLDKQGRVAQPKERFHEGIFLRPAGICILRAAWLRKLGYFPQKASQLGLEQETISVS